MTRTDAITAAIQAELERHHAALDADERWPPILRFLCAMRFMPTESARATRERHLALSGGLARYSENMQPGPGLNPLAGPASE